MKQCITAISLFMGLLVLFSGCETYEKQVTLRLNFQSGTAFEYDQSAVRRWQVMERDSTLEEANSTVSMKILQVVRRTLEDSTAEILEQTSWDIVGPSKEDKSKIDTLHDKREMIIYMSSRGKVVDLEFITPLDSAERQYIREYYDQGFMIFPTEPVHKGSAWTQTADVVLPDTSAVAATTLTVLDFGTEQGYEVIRIGYDGNLLIPFVQDPTDSLQRSGIDRIRIKGTVNFAHNEGLVVNMSERWEIDGDRRGLKEGVMKERKVLVDIDMNYELVAVNTR